MIAQEGLHSMTNMTITFGEIIYIVIMYLLVLPHTCFSQINEDCGYCHNSRPSGVLVTGMIVVCIVFYLSVKADNQVKREIEESRLEREYHKDHHQNKLKEQHLNLNRMVLMNNCVCWGLGLVLADVIVCFDNGIHVAVTGGVCTSICSLMSLWVASLYYVNCSDCLRAHVYMCCWDNKKQPFDACCFEEKINNNNDRSRMKMWNTTPQTVAGITKTQTVAEKAAILQMEIDAFKDNKDISNEDWEKGDLGGKRIVKLPPQFAPGLKRLDLKVNDIVDVSGLTLPEGLTTLDLSVNNIDDVSGLKLPNGLTLLDLSHNRIANLSVLDLPEGLMRLNLSSNNIVEVNKLTLKTGLTWLSLSDNQIVDVSGLKLPAGLKELNLDGNQIKDINKTIAQWKDTNKLLKVTTNELIDEFIKNNKMISNEDWKEGKLFSKEITELPPRFAPGLTKLDLRNNQIEDISNVTFPRALTELDLSHNQIEDISNVTFPRTLTELDLSSNKITEVNSPTLPKLTKLYLQNNSIEKVSGLTLLMSLQVLDLSHNQIKDVSGLTFPEGLTELNLNNTQISNVSQLTLPTKLTKLCLSNNQIVNVSGLPQTLTELDLSGNQIVNLDLQDGLTKLNLSHNQIADLRTWLTFPEGLTELDLSHNQIKDVRYLTVKKGLKKLYLDGNQIVNVNGLTFPQTLTELDLRKNQIVDVSQLTLPKGLTKLNLDRNKIPSDKIASFIKQQKNAGVNVSAEHQLLKQQQQLSCRK